jgi:hypothetical protein
MLLTRLPILERTSARFGLPRSLNPAHAAEPTEKPEQQENEQHQPKNAAQSSSAVSTVGIISATPAEQKHDNYYDQNRTHYSPVREFLTAPAEPGAYHFFSASRTASFAPPIAFWSLPSLLSA